GRQFARRRTQSCTGTRLRLLEKNRRGCWTPHRGKGPQRPCAGTSRRDGRSLRRGVCAIFPGIVFPARPTASNRQRKTGESSALPTSPTKVTSSPCRISPASSCVILNRSVFGDLYFGGKGSRI